MLLLLVVSNPSQSLLPSRLCSAAIVGVSKRWWRVCWNSRQLWRQLAISQHEPRRRMAALADAANLTRTERMEARKIIRQGAERQLGRVAHLAETFTVTYDKSRAPFPTAAASTERRAVAAQPGELTGAAYHCDFS